MNRATRRALSRQQNKLTSRATTRGAKSSGLFAIGRSQPFTEDEFARLSNDARLAWHHLSNGSGTTDHYDELVHALNVSRVLAEQLGGEALEVIIDAQVSALRIRERYQELGVFGVDAIALAAMPLALDLHDEILRNYTPNQMVRALKEANRRLAALKTKTRS